MSKIINQQLAMASALEIDREERETNIRLIRLVTDQPALWDNACPQYRDKGYKKAVIRELAQQMNWTDDAVIKKFANLRTYYTKELNKELLSQVRSKAKGESSEIYRSKWPYYDLLDKFLRMQVRTAKKVHSRLESINSPSIMRVNFDTDSIEHILEAENDDHLDKLDSPEGVHGNRYEDWDDEPVPRKLIKHEPGSPCESELSIRELTHLAPPTVPHTPTPTHLATSTTTVSSHMSQMETSDEIFAKLVSHQLKRVNEGKKKEMLKIKIQQLIVEALFDD